MPRTLEAIDRDLQMERAIWFMERRAGDNCTEALASKRKLDALLEERNTAEKAATRPLGQIR